MSNLAQYRTSVLAVLNDPSRAIYTPEILDQALRWALTAYSRYHPLVLTYMLDTDGHKEMELPDDFEAVKIISVDLYDDDPNLITPVTFYAFKRDEAWYINTTAVIYPAGQVLRITYMANHTIDNLDSAAGTTVPPQDEQVIHTGAAAQAMLIVNQFTV